GPALADARDHSFAAREIGRWEEAAHSAREVRIAALLASGGHGEAVLDARALAEDEPLRESAWALLMRALHQAGRTAEALLEFERMRVVLGRDLALEPSPALRALRSAIQRHSPDLAPRQPGWAVQPLPAAG
ncbi:AfsR/SARP family transcriptional regulator, partial [Streptomyces sparsus]